MPRLNKNILAFDSSFSAGELLKELRTVKPDYVVLRINHPAPQAAEFFVFETQFLTSSALRGVGMFKRRESLVSLLPQLNSESAAPQLGSGHVIYSWNEVYDTGPWPCAFYPVSTAYEHAIGVWEMDEFDVPATGDSPEPDVSDVDDPFPVPMPPPSRGRISDFKDSFGGFFSSGKKSGKLPEFVDFDFLEESIEESFPEAELAEHNTSIVADETDGLLQHHTLFPNIEASNLHPVVEEVVHITVALQTEQVREITGRVNLPDVEDEEYTYEIKVHLLCGDESHWSRLEYSQAQGMVKYAEFALTMPDMPLDLSGNYPDRYKLPLRVNFYFRNRWCGEGERYLDLRLDTVVEPLKRIPPPPQNEWRKLITLQPMAEPPDLLVRIAHKPGTYSYHWSCLSPHLDFDPSLEATITLSGNAQTFVNHLFEPFATIQLDTHKHATLKGICEEIYDGTPEIFKQAYWRLSEAAKDGVFEFNNILFISDEPYIPWELMRVTDPQHQDEAEILSITHSVGRWLAGSSNYLTQQINVQRMVATGSDYVDQKHIPNLPHVEAEMQQLTSRYQAETVPLNSEAVLGFLQNGSAQAVHFACHGRMSMRTPYKSELLMEDHPQSITPPSISAYEVETGLGAEHPLIFLNACQSGAMADSVSLVSGFPAAFLKAGASAVICPLWTVDDEQANVIAQLFYEAAFEQPGMTLGEIMQRIHQRWETEQQLTYLAYVLYGDPQTRVVFSPEISQ